MAIAARLWALVGLVLVGTVGVVAFCATEMRQDLLNDREQRIRQAIALGAGVVAHFEAEERAGRLDRDQAQAAALSAISRLRYGGDEYLWIHRLEDSVMLAHPNAKLIGKSLADMKTRTGENLFHTFNTIARSGGGTYRYEWPRPGEQEPIDKISFVQGFAPWGWVLGTGMYLDDLQAAFRQRALMLAAATLLIVGITGALASLIARSIARPLGEVTRALERLAADQADVTVRHTERKDEIGALARGLMVFREHVEAGRRMAAEKMAHQAAQLERQARVAQLTAEFEDSVGGIVRALSDASLEMQQISESMAAIADQTSRQSTVVAEAAQSAAQNVNEVAAAAEQLRASENEIAEYAGISANVAKTAATETERTGVIVAELTGSAQRIGEVVTFINSLASQINMLALNASIEAARAAEQGRGFAVVANEVKNLANQASRATEEVGGQVAAVCQAAERAANALTSISDVVTRIDLASDVFTNAVERQSSATTAIATSIVEAASATRGVSANVVDVNQAAVIAGHTASQVLEAARHLSRQAQHLLHEVSGYTTAMRSS